MKNLCTPLPKATRNSECGTAKPQSQFKVWTDNIGRVLVYNQKGEDVTEYFDVSVVDGTVVMNYKKPPTLDEWRIIVGKV